MRHFRGSRRRSSTPRLKNSTQHTIGIIGGSPTVGTGILHLLVVPNELAGTALTTARRDNADRQATVANGSIIGRITIDLGIRGVLQDGYVETIVGKVERSHVIPAKGVVPFPSDTDCNTGGSQASYRKDMPGWIWNYQQIPVSAETARTKKIIISPQKFRFGKTRDGDHIFFWVFNKTGGNITIDVNARYKEYY